MDGNRWLIAGGGLSIAASLLHLACIAGGAAWYRFLGAGERIARMAERDWWRPAPVTLLIAGVLAVWGLYALSGAGLILRLPLLRTVLVLVSGVYLSRALAPLAILALRPAMMSPFWWWSSAIVLVYGIAYAVGTWRAWPTLSAGSS